MSLKRGQVPLQTVEGHILHVHLVQILSAAASSVDQQSGLICLDSSTVKLKSLPSHALDSTPDGLVGWASELRLAAFLPTCTLYPNIDPHGSVAILLTCITKAHDKKVIREYDIAMECQNSRSTGQMHPEDLHCCRVAKSPSTGPQFGQELLTLTGAFRGIHTGHGSGNAVPNWSVAFRLHPYRIDTGWLSLAAATRRAATTVYCGGTG